MILHNVHVIVCGCVWLCVVVSLSNSTDILNNEQELLYFIQRVRAFGCVWLCVYVCQYRNMLTYQLMSRICYIAKGVRASRQSIMARFVCVRVYVCVYVGVYVCVCVYTYI